MSFYSRLLTRSDLTHGKVPDSSARGWSATNGLLNGASEAASMAVWNSLLPHPDCSQAADPSPAGEIGSSRRFAAPPTRRALPCSGKYLEWRRRARSALLAAH
jgi:hypothetical protein